MLARIVGELPTKLATKKRGDDPSWKMSKRMKLPGLASTMRPCICEPVVPRVSHLVSTSKSTFAMSCIRRIEPLPLDQTSCEAPAGRTRFAVRSVVPETLTLPSPSGLTNVQMPLRPAARKSSDTGVPGPAQEPVVNEEAELAPHRGGQPAPRTAGCHPPRLTPVAVRSRSVGT
jgi:hypothetical protein